MRSGWFVPLAELAAPAACPEITHCAGTMEPTSASPERPDERAAERLRGLTAAMRSGEEGAFTGFYECYYERLFRYLLVLTRGNEGVTRELLQATMTKAMRNIRIFSDETLLWNWLAAIGRNCFIDHARKRRRSPQIVPLFDNEWPELAASGKDDNDQRLFAILEDCLAGLAEEERALVRGFYFEEGTQRTLAAQKGVSEKAVECRLARIREKLRQAMLTKLRYENH